MNRLGREKSPYLLQHADNPVDWYPWGTEAFERARSEDKPVFLSIGYSTCHWCHVMEQESFADESAARLLNETFVCIKVDREERPDLDQYFMAVGQALTGSGGWPLTIVMTPEGKPFFAGTYFPKERRWGHPGLTDLIPRIDEAWRTRRDEVLRSADGIVAAVCGVHAPAVGLLGGRPELGLETLDKAFHDFEADFDGKHGGFGSPPKFLVPHNLTFLLRYGKRTGHVAALAMAEETLLAMRRGGVWDHLGFGFHRYSTDAAWRVPHFEKMLYDQALMAEAYGEAFLATGKPGHKQTATETLEYVLRDLSSPDGGFYTAEDADSEGEEGRFYCWTTAEMRAALGDRDSSLAIEAFGVREDGNFAGPGGTRDGRNVLYLEGTTAEAAGTSGTQAGGREIRLASIRRKLFLAREKRARPFRDTKILADWNGLAIGALAKVARMADDTRFLAAAEKAARFVLGKMRGPAGRLFHAYMGGEARVPAFLDDYAFVIRGLIELYQANFDPESLEAALDLSGAAMSLFQDAKGGGFFSVPADSELPVRPKDAYDGAVPSGNSVMLMNLLRLARLTGRPELEGAAVRLTSAFAAQVGAHPRVHAEFLRGLDYALGPATEVVVVGRLADPQTAGLLEVLNKTFLPNSVVLFKPSRAGKAESTEYPEGRAARIGRLAPFTKDMKENGAQATVYVCTGGHCLEPAASPERLARLLSVKAPNPRGL